MIARGNLDKWASAALGLICLSLIAYLLRQTGVRAQGPAATTRAATKQGATKRALRSNDTLAQFDPIVKLELLDRLQARPEPHLKRNPFEYPAPKLPPAPSGSVSTPTVPPPPPPPPLKYMGFTETGGGVPQAMISEKVSEEVSNSYVVHENETFANRYKVLKITPAMVEVEDATTRQTVQLPVQQ